MPRSWSWVGYSLMGPGWAGSSEGLCLGGNEWEPTMASRPVVSGLWSKSWLAFVSIKESFIWTDNEVQLI